MNCRFPRPDASCRLFCFPWAGGGASFYTAWGEDITEDVEVIGVCLAGRENRFNEPCCDNAKETIDWIVKTLHDEYFDKPFAFYGHSMGALLSFLVALEIKRLYNKEPEHMFLSGTTAPHSPHRQARILNVNKLTKDEFLEKLKVLGGIPAEIYDNPELMEIFYPSMYADFCMVPQLKYEQSPEDKPPLNCPIDFFDGTEDTDHDIAAWKQVTKGSFTFRKMPGGHFFLKEPENTRKLINYVNQRFGGFEDIC
ncbi:S-acyl fatty acid synthase thioesterase, medium chain-like [Physella acuta]|uniref:S-acyl fatty acid synthase thioesterase, medium chain-like n=1 Tax=Physella acuta TaxID=109671 RepID=UPI0027DB8D82|nr:S-acyl fatty acid synthase thioesterase, medium chain-like [Physella acuta]